MLDRLERNIRDMMAKGYTVEQMIAAHYERIMTPALTKQWRKFCAKHQDPPPVYELLWFLKQVNAMLDVLLDKDGSDLPLADPQRQFCMHRLLHISGFCVVYHLLFLSSQFKEKTNTQLVKCHFCYNCLTYHQTVPATQCSRLSLVKLPSTWQGAT